MSAVMNHPGAKLRFKPSKALPRTLLIAWDAYGTESVHINAHAFLGGSSIAYAGVHAAAEASLRYYASNEPVLWLGSAQFSLTDAEAGEVERMLAPLGLRIDRSEASQ